MEFPWESSEFLLNNRERKVPCDEKRRQAADRIDRTQQSARQIENNGQERRRPRRRGWGTAGRVIGTILLVFVLTAAIFAGIFPPTSTAVCEAV